MTIANPYTVPFTPLSAAFVASVPGSKSLTNRAVIAAALCDTKVTLKRPLLSEDTEVAFEALRSLGVEFEVCGEDWVVDASRWHCVELKQRPNLYLANAGTAVRFLSSVLAAKSLSCRIYGSDRMHERPIDILLHGLNDLGANIRSENENGCPPLVIEKSTLKGGKTTLSGQVSSQFFSGLMMACPLAEGDSVIKVSDAWLSKPYIEMTANMLKSFGITLTISASSIHIPGLQKYKSPGIYEIEPDASAATYPLGLAVLHGVPVAIEGLGRLSLQGDVKFVEVLEAMGCEIELHETRMSVRPPAQLRAIDLNLNHIPDAAMTVVMLCAVAEGKSRLTGLKNLAFKECDRLKALEKECRKIGARVNANHDGFEIEGVPWDQLHGAEIDTYNDHRMAMCLALMGTKIKDLKIRNPMCVNKTYPTFWNDLNHWLGL